MSFHFYLSFDFKDKQFLLLHKNKDKITVDLSFFLRYRYRPVIIPLPSRYHFWLAVTIPFLAVTVTLIVTLIVTFSFNDLSPS